MLLIRGLIGWFKQQPYRGKLVRWGTELHDRFMLPHYVWEDFELVIDDLSNAGFGFERDWFRAFHDFRFPRYGAIVADDIELEVRGAIEPWHVLGEESGTQGTARYVDSSVERLQVKVSGLREDRYTIACNKREIPLRPTGTRGEFVAGVRFKAWNPPSSLHPTIDVHTPLVFDIVDTANERVIAACTYHVSHPGGRNYDTFPVNAFEAEARRVARFSDLGRNQGRIDLKPAHPHPDHPYTLDLRRR